MRIGVVNRYTAEKRERYPLGLALQDAGAAFIPIDVRELGARVAGRGRPTLALADPVTARVTPLDELALDGIVWRVSEAAFGRYGNLLELLADRYPVVNGWECNRTCSDKWRTTAALASASLPVVPTVLVPPGGTVPAFPDRDTVVKPCVSAGGEGVRVAAAHRDLDITEPFVAQPLLDAPARDHLRVLVCGSAPVAAMRRIPPPGLGDENGAPDAGGAGGWTGARGGPQVNNLAAGGTPEPASTGPVGDLAATAARCVGGDIVGVDLVPWDGDFAVLEVNSAPGLTGIASVAAVDCYRVAAETILARLGEPAT